MLADADRKVSDLYGMVHPEADPSVTVRSVFVIDPAKKVRLILTYPPSTGRNFEEILRVVDSLQLTDAHKVATPVNWQDGRGRDHRAVAVRRGGQGALPGRVQDAETLSAHGEAAEIAAPRLTEGKQPLFEKSGAKTFFYAGSWALSVTKHGPA